MFGATHSLSEGRLPVFVFPTNVTFYSDDQASHKQVLTLYNPYDFPIRFKVLCTSPRKYSVVDSEGSIKPGYCVDIVVRHNDICINNEGVRDKFRIHLTEHGQKKVLGNKDVTSVLMPTKDTSTFAEETFESLPMLGAHQQQQPSTLVTNKSGSTKPDSGVGTGPSVVVILLGAVCIATLMLPSQGEKGSSLPDYLHLNLHQKLIAAYILGLVTMVILRA